jgi:hypothetical protein
MANKRSIKVEDDEFNPKKRQRSKAGTSTNAGSSGKLVLSYISSRMLIFEFLPRLAIQQSCHISAH